MLNRLCCGNEGLLECSSIRYRYEKSGKRHDVSQAGAGAQPRVLLVQVSHGFDPFTQMSEEELAGGSPAAAAALDVFDGHFPGGVMPRAHVRDGDGMPSHYHPPACSNHEASHVSSSCAAEEGPVVLFQERQQVQHQQVGEQQQTPGSSAPLPTQQWQPLHTPQTHQLDSVRTQPGIIPDDSTQPRGPQEHPHQQQSQPPQQLLPRDDSELLAHLQHHSPAHLTGSLRHLPASPHGMVDPPHNCTSPLMHPPSSPPPLQQRPPRLSPLAQPHPPPHLQPPLSECAQHHEGGALLPAAGQALRQAPPHHPTARSIDVAAATHMGAVPDGTWPLRTSSGTTVSPQHPEARFSLCALPLHHVLFVKLFHSRAVLQSPPACLMERPYVIFAGVGPT